MVDRPIWEQPGPGTRSGYDWDEISRQLRARPNEWMRVFELGPTSLANSIRQSEVRSLTPVRRKRDTTSGFEIRTRNNQRGTPRMCSLYLRFVPEE